MEMITQIANIDDVSGIVFRIDGETSWLGKSVFDLIQKHTKKLHYIFVCQKFSRYGATDDHWRMSLVEEVFASFVRKHLSLRRYFADVDRGYYRSMEL